MWTFYIYSLLRFFKFPYNFCGDFRRTCNPRDNYMHFTGYALRHGDPLHFLWGKNLQCRLSLSWNSKIGWTLCLSTKVRWASCLLLTESIGIGASVQVTNEQIELRKDNKTKISFSLIGYENNGNFHNF